MMQPVLLDIEDRISRLQELLHFVAPACEGLDELQSTTIARGIQLAHGQPDDIKDALLQIAWKLPGASNVIPTNFKRLNCSSCESNVFQRSKQTV